MSTYRLKTLFPFAAALLLAATPCHARYTLYRHSGNVSVVRNGQRVSLKKDMELNALDLIKIGKGGSVEIFNDRNSRIYKSKEPGEHSVSRIITDAKGQASDHIGGINDKMRFGKSNDDGKVRVYAAKGMVTHALDVFDPEGKDLQVDPLVLGRHIVASLADTASIDHSPFPALLKKEPAGESGIAFRVENPLSFPVYFNIIKVESPDSIRISELGQPTGCYVVLPGQTLSREQLSGFDSKALHLLVMTHCYFDIDKVIETVAELIAEGPKPDNDNEIRVSLPIYVRTL